MSEQLIDTLLTDVPKDFPILNMVTVGPSPDGKVCYWMPPNPVSDPRAVTMTVDWVKYPELFEQRKRVGIGGLVPDGMELLMRNFEANASLGKFADWKELWGAEKGKTALVLGAGPSLKESLPEIRKMARDTDKYFTIAMNRSLNAYPFADYYHIADRRGDRDWTEAHRNYDATTLVASVAVACQHPPRFKKRYWGEHFFHDLPDTGLTRISTELSITYCDTMFLAYKLGASKILLYGCDYAMSGHFEKHPEGGDGNVAFLEQYYHDQEAAQGMAIREHLFPMKPPVVGLNGRVVFTTWELMCYACYTSVMAYMIENSGGVPVYNRSPAGVLFETWHRPGSTHGSDISDNVQVCAAEAQG